MSSRRKPGSRTFAHNQWWIPAFAGMTSKGLPLLLAIDWQQPWFAPYCDLGQAVAGQVARGDSLAAALNAHCAVVDLQFVAPQAQGGEAYEAFVARTGCVPTRDNAHDFFNGLVWLRWPVLKRRINLLHAGEIARQGGGATRGAVRDRLTLFDENGALLAAPSPLQSALQRRDWQDLFIAQRALWHDARLTIVGHALLEKLVQPRKAITAHVWLGDAAHASGESAPIEPPFAPLPVLGVPGWWPGNERPQADDIRRPPPAGGKETSGGRAFPCEDREFYADVTVFRPARSPRSTDSAHPCRS